MSDDPSMCPAREALVDRYLHGECMVMADTLSRRHGLALVGIHDDVWTDVPRHVGVLTGRGTYGDVRGLDLDRQAFLAGYAGPGVRIVPVAAEAMRSIWGHRIGSWNVPDAEMETLGLAQRSLAA